MPLFAAVYSLVQAIMFPIFKDKLCTNTKLGNLFPLLLI